MPDENEDFAVRLRILHCTHKQMIGQNSIQIPIIVYPLLHRVEIGAQNLTLDHHLQIFYLVNEMSTVNDLLEDVNRPVVFISKN